MFGLVFLFLLFNVGCIMGHELYQTESKLRKNILCDYDRNVPPQQSLSSPVNVQIGLSLVNIDSLNSATNMLMGKFYLGLSWNDPRLEWNPSDYGNLTETYSIHQEDIWVPDIFLYSGEAQTLGLLTGKIQAVVYYNGNVTWVPPISIQNPCAANLSYLLPVTGTTRAANATTTTRTTSAVTGRVRVANPVFPPDITDLSAEQERLARWCTFRFGPWASHNGRVVLSYQIQNANTMDSVSYKSGTGRDDWAIINNYAETQNRSFPCCIPAFTSVIFNIKVIKKMYL